jgi:hypothetical protein
MSAGTIAGDRIWALAGPAPTPRVSLRPPSGFAVSSPIAVPARASCHRQASPRRERGLWSWRHLARQWSASPVAAAYPFGGRGAAGPACAGASHRGAPSAPAAVCYLRAHQRRRPPASRKGAGESSAFRRHLWRFPRQAGAGRHPGDHRSPGDHRRDSLPGRRSELAAFHGGERSHGTSLGPGGRLVCGRRSAPGRCLVRRQGGVELPLAGSWRSRSWPSSRPRRGKLPHPGSSGSPRPAGAWPAGGGRRGHRGGNLVMSLAGPHDRLPSCPRQPRAQRQVPHARPLPAYTSGELAAIVTQRARNAGEVSDRPPRPPTAETEVFSRGCPKLTPSARSSHDRASDRWDRGRMHRAA